MIKRMNFLYNYPSSFINTKPYQLNKVLACKLLARQIDDIFDKGVFNGGDLIALLEVLIASDVLHEESTSSNEVYFQMCNDRLKDLLYNSFTEVVINA